MSDDHNGRRRWELPWYKDGKEDTRWPRVPPGWNDDALVQAMSRGLPEYAGQAAPRFSPGGYVPSGEPRGGMLPEGEGWLERMILMLLGPQTPRAPLAPPARPAALQGINGMLPTRAVPYTDQYPYPRVPPRG